MKQLRFENLYTPEYYLDIPGYDSRIAIRKFIDVRDTLGMAKLSLSYVNTDPSPSSTPSQPSQPSSLADDFVKTVHLRHAIQDLNSSFDLLMQIPWFFYRIWEEYNPNGSLKTEFLNNHNEIQRNTENWVEKAEKECNRKKVVKYLKAKQYDLADKIKEFTRIYINNKDKAFTVRSLCNEMKHNHALEFEELYEPYDFIVSLDNQKLNLREENLGIEMHQDIADFSSGTSDNEEEAPVVGRVNYIFKKDLEINIEYIDSDSFNFKDCTHETNRITISEVYKECCEYFDASIGLFEEIYSNIYPQIELLPSLIGENGKPKISLTNRTSISLNEYFTSKPQRQKQRQNHRKESNWRRAKHRRKQK